MSPWGDLGSNEAMSLTEHLPFNTTLLSVTIQGPYDDTVQAVLMGDGTLRWQRASYVTKTWQSRQVNLAQQQELLSLAKSLPEPEEAENTPEGYELHVSWNDTQELGEWHGAPWSGGSISETLTHKIRQLAW